MDIGGVKLEQKRNKQETRSRKKRKKHGTFFRVFTTIVLIGIITTAMLLCMAAVYIKNVIMPAADLQLESYTTNLTTTMYYKDPATTEYVEMQTLYGDENRVWVTRDEIPKNLMNAAVAIEDKRFYDHNGVDWIRTVNGVLLMFTGRDIQGGSTLTQQLIKNLTTEDDVTVKRKITEIFRALEFEKKYSKEDILEWYLNYIYLGQGCNGVYTASYAYFGKHVSELSLAECASLIGITNNPSKYDPFAHLEVTDPKTGEVKTAKDFNKQRQETILYAMAEQGYITEEDRDAAIAEELVFNPAKDENKKSTVYTWYEDAVINDVIEDLMTTYNWSEEVAKNAVFSGGLEIYTCMNPNVQTAVDEVYGDKNNLNYNSGTGQAIQSAITIVDNETGNVVAMAGGVGEKTSSRGWNRATQSLRPPGSSIKPLAVYAPAIELGKITPITTYEDSPYQYDNGKGWPVNATGRYQGEVSVTKALTESINTVAVKVLADITPQVSFDFMQDRFHIDLVESRVAGNKNYTDVALAPLALGGLTEGVSTFDMAAAYSAFPRQGTYITPRTYTMVLNSKDEILLDNTSKEEEAMTQRTSYYINQMLQQVVTAPNGTGKKANFSGQDIAGKTGTTTSRKDLWFVGYTPYYTAAVWTGYDRQERLASGLGNPSTSMFNLVMQKVHSGLPYKEFKQPDSGSLKTVTYCTRSGKLPNGACSGSLAVGTFFPEDVPTTYCDVHRFIPVTPQTPSERPIPSIPDGGGTEETPGDTLPPVETPPVEPAPGEGEVLE